MNLELVRCPPAAGSLAASLQQGCQRSIGRFPRAATLAGSLLTAKEVLASPAPRQAVAQRLLAYNQSLGNPHAAALSEALMDPRCLVVVAGQQPGVFGGALLLFAKVARAVALARDLTRHWDGPVVPIFWNHSEDHDVDEARRFGTFEQGSVRRHRAPLGPQGFCLDHVVGSEDLTRFAQELMDGLAWAHPPRDLMPGPDDIFSLWTARVISAYLHDMPLLQAEPRILRPLLAPLLERVVQGVRQVGEALMAGEAEVKSLGFQPQVRVRDASPLFLVASNGRRLRLSFDQAWSLRQAQEFDPEAPTSPTTQWLADQAHERPECFSTNVLLRPLALQYLLPVVVQVCGPAEIAYFAQLPELYAWAGLPFPVVQPRAHMTLLGPQEDLIRKGLALDGEQLLQDPSSWPEAAQEGDSSPSRRERHQLAEWVHPRGRPQDRVLGPLALLPGQDPRVLGRALQQVRPWDQRHHLITFTKSSLQSCPKIAEEMA